MFIRAEEFGFYCATSRIGVYYERACHPTCPVGILTRSGVRKNFKGKPEHVINYTFVAEEMRIIMADLGFRTVKMVVNRKINMKKAVITLKKGIDVSKILLARSWT